MEWSGQFSDFDNFIQQQNRGNKPASSYRHDRPYNIPTNDSVSNTKLENIYLGCTSIVNVVGIILSREEGRSVQSRKNSGTERYVLNFTLRDSTTLYVNVTFWGREHYIKELTDRFHIGDIVSLSNVQVLGKSQDGSDEKYRPVTPVPFSLSGSENHSNINWYNGPDTDIFIQLKHTPVKATNDFYTLEDILANGQGLHGEHVNILCVIRKIGPIKEITTKSGKHVKRCELRILDETNSSFALILWEKELIDIALTWTPLDTVLFVTDVKITYDDYRSTMVATADSKTIVTVNPDTLEAQSLYQFAHTQDFQASDDSFSNKADPNLETINDLYTISDIKQIVENQGEQWKQTLYGILYVYLSHFNIDGGGHVLRYRCEKCRQIVHENQGFMCCNGECSNGALALFDASVTSDKQPVIEYACPVSLSDHTGTLDNCFLDGAVVENFIGIKAEDFKPLDLDRKTEIKWNFLLERCKVYFKIFNSDSNSGRRSRSVLKVISIRNDGIHKMELNLNNEQ